MAYDIRIASEKAKFGFPEINVDIAFEKTQWALCFATEDHNERISAFLKKRKPTFKGK